MDKDSGKHDLDMSEAARAMGKRRWHGMKEAERKEFMAKARAKIKLTKAERSEIGRKAITARWAKARASKPASVSAVVARAKLLAGARQNRGRKPKET